MVVIDRVLCDSCGCVIGQLFNRPAQYAQGLEDSSSAPFLVQCPDCSPVTAFPVQLYLAAHQAAGV